MGRPTTPLDPKDLQQEVQKVIYVDLSGIKPSRVVDAMVGVKATVKALTNSAGTFANGWPIQAGTHNTDAAVAKLLKGKNSPENFVLKAAKSIRRGVNS